MGTSVIYAMEYLLGLAMFGLVYWLLDGILPEFAFVSVQDTAYNFAWYMWDAAIIIYILFGMFYFYRSIKIWKVGR